MRPGAIIGSAVADFLLTTLSHLKTDSHHFRPSTVVPPFSFSKVRLLVAIIPNATVINIPKNPVNTPWAYTQTKDKFDEPIFGKGGGLIFGKKNTSICNLLNLLFILFFSMKHVFRHFLGRARFEICLKLTIKTPEYVKLTIKLKIKTPLTSFWRLYCLL